MKALIFLSFLLSGCGGRTPVTPIDTGVTWRVPFIDSLSDPVSDIYQTVDLCICGGK
jgi:hypothetical protein